ncbi:hypothetical protein CRM22_006862 [Opisthorchis felineus]|uniref:Uncharacterized protein n=1 Tax=Opisthorchis felineus TaxID=147828 RepID=A0A4S2LJ58_OPIFE|nr:hypothetical protein CRM22_006862 [Opisthorchis felineus]
MDTSKCGFRVCVVSWSGYAAYLIEGVVKKHDGSPYYCNDERSKANAIKELRQMAGKVIFGSSFKSVTLREQSGQCRASLEVAVNMLGRAKLRMLKPGQDVGAFIARKFQDYMPKSGVLFRAESPMSRAGQEMVKFSPSTVAICFPFVLRILDL